MSVISSLLSLQSSVSQNEETVAVLKDCQDRVNTMAYVHEILSMGKDPVAIELGSYLKKITSELLQSFADERKRIQINVDADSIKVDSGIGISCGLIVNELVTNSFKYAFPDNRDGVISIELKKQHPGEVELNISDNGVGLPENFDRLKIKSLGLTLIYSLVQQIGGHIEMENNQGARACITFPLSG